MFFVNDPSLFSEDYKRYMEKQLRTSVGFPGTPLRLFWRGKPEHEKGTVQVGAKPAGVGGPQEGAVGRWSRHRKLSVAGKPGAGKAGGEA